MVPMGRARPPRAPAGRADCQEITIPRRASRTPRALELEARRRRHSHHHYHHLAERIIAVPSRTVHALVHKWTHTLWERRRRDRARSCPG